MEAGAGLRDDAPPPGRARGEREPLAGDIVHTQALYLLDRRGDERSGYLYPYVPVRVAHDLRVLAQGRNV